MIKHNANAFNKEKLLFLISAGLLGYAAYAYFSGRPDQLEVDVQLTERNRPERILIASRDVQGDPRYYVKRERKSPFTPSSFLIEQPKEVKPTVVAGAAPPKVPAPPPQDEKIAKQEKNFDPRDRELGVTFMGVVHLNDKRYGLLAQKDGSPPLRVEVGQVLEAYEVKVVKIERQEIHFEDIVNQTPFVLKDGRFESSSGGGFGSEKSSDRKSERSSVKERSTEGKVSHSNSLAMGE